MQILSLPLPLHSNMISSLSIRPPSFFPIHGSKGSSLSIAPPSFFPLNSSKVSSLSTSSKEEGSPRYQVPPPDSVLLRFSHLLRFTSDFLDHTEVADLTTGNDGEQSVGIRRLLVEATGLNQVPLAHLCNRSVADHGSVKRLALLNW
ncbi:hypothetical protein ZIOFF_048267 [Zingiber officinale]|uniref:Uncharacterized protein n=1 Tax=Zingiber officinale TaxID=94328 RepID=A0A8J5FPF3_ZINOF|nr:hypothetical protein ZIOFF_048267 [Zingiber officinale]